MGKVTLTAGALGGGTAVAAGALGVSSAGAAPAAGGGAVGGRSVAAAELGELAELAELFGAAAAAASAVWLADVLGTVAGPADGRFTTSEVMAAKQTKATSARASTGNQRADLGAVAVVAAVLSAGSVVGTDPARLAPDADPDTVAGAAIACAGVDVVVAAPTGLSVGGGGLWIFAAAYAAGRSSRNRLCNSRSLS